MLSRAMKPWVIGPSVSPPRPRMTAAERAISETGWRMVVKVGQTLKAEIIGVDTAERKIGLSFRGAARAEELADAQGFTGGVPTATLGDVMRDKRAGLAIKHIKKKGGDSEE